MFNYTGMRWVPVIYRNRKSLTFFLFLTHGSNWVFYWSIFGYVPSSRWNIFVPINRLLGFEPVLHYTAWSLQLNKFKSLFILPPSQSHFQCFFSVHVHFNCYLSYRLFFFFISVAGNRLAFQEEARHRLPASAAITFVWDRYLHSWDWHGEQHTSRRTFCRSYPVSTSFKRPKKT